MADRRHTISNPRPLPPKSDLDAVFEYNADSGELRWRHRLGTGFGRRNGLRAGSVCGNHRTVSLNKVLYLEHRIIWKLMTGNDPAEVIDHIDGDGTNNRWSNLREATVSLNGHNAKSRSKRYGTAKGVSFHLRDKRWRAQIRIGYKQKHLGTFETEAEAAKAYETARKALIGEW